MNINLSQVMKQKLNDKKDTNPDTPTQSHPEEGVLDTHMIPSRLMKGGELLKGKISQHEILMTVGKFELSISA